ncbi:MAG: hypothetical protein COW03_12655 [Cytophagales bacterium CG12_big_fil_rev_8_21_14_0_65_40_12]|nr:MAG: hypothetical protein COW03_12655 [Cytophagales bacterium CG12_big_fil_rev_8_21_14_0_65_40_12]PIW02995.1 MAG: hypothetical protein COW40_16735 [Cytophagales bacterium CG17_big_fil_post_rev_8_21_14_2_50_40_13]
MSIGLQKSNSKKQNLKSQITNSKKQVPRLKTQDSNFKSTPVRLITDTKDQNSVTLSPKLAWYGICLLATRIKKLTK